jgi:hypothetical protein
MFKIRTNEFVNNCTIDFGDLTLSFSNGVAIQCTNTCENGVSHNVEVAIIDKDGNFVTKQVWMQIFGLCEMEYDDVASWVDAKTFAKLVAGLAAHIVDED